jgi:hypothetical protein
MPGGLIQLVGKGAQDQLITGNPSFTHFHTMYKRHTEFAMEHFRLDFRTSTVELPTQGTRSMRVRVDRNAQLVHDCYLRITLPDIFSPVSPITPGISPKIAPDATAVGYDFQWIHNIGYNMIRNVSVLINGTAVVTHTGEWMKFFSYTTHDANKRGVVDHMVGHVPELHDPANAGIRINQYPHAISTATTPASPSINTRELVIPLHFWFCEDVGSALPLVALQYSEVEFLVEFRNIYELFTVRDVRQNSPTFLQRIAPDAADPLFSITRFLSPPTVTGSPSNPSLTNWSANPYVEANYIFVSDPEMVNLAKSDNAFKIKEVRMVRQDNVTGAGNDIELRMVNLCTRIVWAGQRTDIASKNDWDNYTNWKEPDSSPYNTLNLPLMTPYYSSGIAQGTNIREHEILVDGVLLLDGAERFPAKQQSFFSLLQNYRHHTGKTITSIPGMYTYSFALDNHNTQPSGHLNGSMFNKTILRLTTHTPPFIVSPTVSQQCIVKSTALNQNPVQVINPSVFNPEQVVSVINKSSGQTYQYTYSVRAHVESYNFLRVTRGIANVMFSS